MSNKTSKLNRGFTLFYLAWAIGGACYDAVIGSWWTLVMLAFLPLASYWFYQAWIKDGPLGKQSAT